MGELADRLGGKVDGELIRATDWNALIEGIEKRFDVLAERVDAAETRTEANEAALAATDDRIAALEATQQIIEGRYRNLELSTERTAFAIGERAEIVARVTAFDGSDLSLTRIADRPWIDFVTVWGSLKAARGFTARAGTGGKTVSVQVNANGEARALLREDTGVVFPEEEELEITAVLATTVSGQSVAQRILSASTPGATTLNGAYAAVTSAYERSDTLVMRNYLDGIYLANPTRNYPPLTPTFTFNWHDEYATVLAFVKPDDNPGSGDSAMAAGSIRVTFRDWVYPWIMQYIPPPPPLIDDYTAIFIPELVAEIDVSTMGIFDIITRRTADIGLLGQQRQWAAASKAIGAIPTDARPAHFNNLEANVMGGLAVQQGMAYSSALGFAGLPGAGAGAAVANVGARGEAAANTLVAVANEETTMTFNRFEGKVLDQVRAENQRFNSELLGDNGPVRQAEIIATQAAGRIDEINQQLSSKAGLELVSQLLAVRDGG